MRSRFLVLGLLLTGACDHGLEPPPPAPLGAIDVQITYQGRWPSADSLFDARFVAFRFMPQDTADFFRLTEIVFSHRLQYYVDSERVFLDSIEAGPFVYSGVAHRFSSSLLDWRPVGLYEADDGMFTVEIGETTHVDIAVDFRHLPPFPPPGLGRAP